MLDAKVICDSISPTGSRITTVQITCHRYIWSEVLTHGLLAKNSSSSRARPTKFFIEQIRNDLAYPVEFGLNQPGMRADRVLENDEEARDEWQLAAFDAIYRAERLLEIGIHKQVVNRLLEPFMWHTAILTGTYWDNFFDLRCHPDAQPEFQAIARLIREAREASTPNKVWWGECHLPYILDEERSLLFPKDPDALTKASVARCARVSHKNFDGVVDLVKDLELFDKLTSSIPMHSSPLMHVATPHSSVRPKEQFLGWITYREIFESKNGIVSVR